MRVVLRCLSLIVLLNALTGCESSVATGQGIQKKAGAQVAKPAAANADTAVAELPLLKDPKITLSKDDIRDGWIQLFDGQTLAGWFPNNDVNWHVNADGEIEASTGEPGLLLTSVPFADYELRCDFWVAKAGNSGIFLRTLANPKKVDTDCYELNMWDSAPEFKTGSLVGRAHPKKPITGEEVWKSFVVRCLGRRITVMLDGEEILDFTDNTPGLRLAGHIGLQKNAGRVRFRNVALKPLSAKPLFNGTDLKGWHPVAGSKASFNVVDGAIEVKGGAGFLETDGSWANFVLQVEANSASQPVNNSGVFFRLIPGTEKAPSNGYELQLNHAVEEGNRRKPKDAGTGAIFRRTKARYVPASDAEWCTVTLVASGPRFASWVNGFQVTDWEDRRAADANPRKGLKLEAGPLSLQGHDPTTRVLVRNVRLAPLP